MGVSSYRSFRGSIAKRLTSVVAVVLLATAFLVGGSVPANAALPAGPSTVGVTGARPGATEIPFAISDQVAAFVDVGTGNLRVVNSSLSLVGVNGPVAITQSYNALGTSVGATSIPAANKWTAGIQGAGFLSAGSSGSIIYTAGNGSTWRYTPIVSVPGTFTAPAGAKADLVTASGGAFTLTDRTSRTVVRFNSDGQPTKVTDRNGNETNIAYTSGAPVSVTSSAGPAGARVASLTYSPATRTLTASQSNGALSRSVKWVKDASSNLTSIVDAEGKTTSFSYTGQLLTSITAPGGAVTTITYESGLNRVLSVAQSNTTSGSPGTSVTRIAYTLNTQRLVARPNTNQSVGVTGVPNITYTIDPTTRLVTNVTDEMGRERSTTFTVNGDVATSVSGTGTTAGTTTSTYGANGGDSRTSVAGPGGATRTTAFANTSTSTQYLASSSVDDAGNSSTYTYNGAGNPLTSTNALAAVASLETAADGTITSATAPGNGTNKTTYVYNGDKQLHVMTPADAPVGGDKLAARTYGYDDFGRLRTATNGRGVTTTYTYDRQNRLLSTSFSDTTPTVTYTYTDRGQIATRVDANGTTTYGYDQLGRLITRANSFAGGTITYGYDKSSNLISTTDSRGTTTNAFDASGVPTQITYATSSGTKILGFATDDQGRRTDTWLRTNASRSVWTAHVHQDYDTTGRVSRVISRVNSTGTPNTVVDTSYCYNSATPAPTCGTGTTTDRVKLQWERNNLNAQVTAYTYDGAGRLLTANQSGGSSPNSHAYTYDARGNRLTDTVTGTTPSTQTLTYNAANQLTNAGYTFDATGNMTADPSGTYTYNGAEQMTNVTNGSGSFTYKYAGSSQVEVLQQQTPTSTYQLVYGRTNSTGLPVIEQVKIGGNTAYIENDPVTGQPLMLRTSSGTEALYVYSGTGNPIALALGTGSLIVTSTYDPYGVVVASAGSSTTAGNQNPYGFKSGIQDRATGWVHFGNRWYNPAIGRWTQQDTLDAPMSPLDANRYAYSGSDPINNTDPTGRDAIRAFGWAAELLGFVDLAIAIANGDSRQIAIEAVSIGVGVLTGAICGALVGASSLAAGPFGSVAGVAFCAAISTLISEAVVGFN